MIRRFLIALVVIAVAAAAAVYWLFSGDGVRRALEQQATAWLGQPVRIGSATAQLFPRVAIRLRGVRVGEPARLALAEVEVSTDLGGLLSRRIEDAELIVSDSRIEMPLPFTLPTDANKPAQNGSEAGGVTVASIREITLDDIRIVSRGREILVSAQSSLTGSRLVLESFSARAGGTSMEASGVVEMSPRVDAKLEATANRLDVDDLLALADAFAPAQRQPARGGPLVEGRIAAKVTAERGSAAGVELRQLAANMLVQGNRVALTPASFELFGGRYEGAVDARMGDSLSVSLTSRINNLDVGQLASFGGVPDAISGRLSGNGRFTGRGADFAAVLRSATGSGTAVIADGTIRGLELVRTVVLFFGRPAADAPAGSGSRFTRIATAFTLARQVIRTDSLSLASPDVDIAAAGTLTIPTKELDGRADLVLSESLSAQAGTDLVRFTREGNRVILPATIGGTIAQPIVMIDAAAAVQRGLRNEAERRLKGLLDRLKPPQ